MKIISSNYVPSEKPYQVIEYAGYIGMQIGTLVVTEENPDAGGKYGIVSHCHPVVSYTRKMMTDSAILPSLMTARGYAECAVWDNLELGETRTVCHIPDLDDKVEISFSDFHSLMLLRNINRIYNTKNVLANDLQDLTYSLTLALEKLGITVKKPHKFNTLLLRIFKKNPFTNEAKDYCYVGWMDTIAAYTTISDTKTMYSEIVQIIEEYLNILGRDFPLIFYNQVPEFEDLANALNEKYGGGSKKG